MWSTGSLCVDYLENYRTCEKSVMNIKCMCFNKKCKLFINVNQNWNVMTKFYTFHNIKVHENPSHGSQVVTCGKAANYTWLSK
jgi:hypothetical protein